MYEIETLDPDEDDGTMVRSLNELAEQVIGHRIVRAENETKQVPHWNGGMVNYTAFVITLDDGTQVELHEYGDCCAFTELQAFLLHPDKVDHIITGVGTEGNFTTWHIYADAGDVLELTVGWSCGNPFYYAYGFDIKVIPLTPEPEEL